jgi:hypothetical protein
MRSREAQTPAKTCSRKGPNSTTKVITTCNSRELEAADHSRKGEANVHWIYAMEQRLQSSSTRKETFPVQTPSISSCQKRKKTKIRKKLVETPVMGNNPISPCPSSGDFDIPPYAIALFSLFSS